MTATPVTATPLTAAAVPRQEITRAEADLFTWLAHAAHAAGDWEPAVRDALRSLLMRPRLEQRLLVIEPQLADSNPANSQPKVERVTIARDETWIGRGPDNHVVLPSEAIGHRHARIVRRDRNYFIEDLATTVGTWLNRERVEPRHPVQIFHGDEIRIFPYSLRYQATAEWVAEGEVQVHAHPPRWTAFGSLDRAAGWLRYGVVVHPQCPPLQLSVDGDFVRRVISSVTKLDDVRIVVPPDRSLVELFVLTLLAALNRQLHFPFACRLVESPRFSDDTRGVVADVTVGLEGFTGGWQWFLPAAAIGAARTIHPVEPGGGPEAVVPARFALRRAAMRLGDVERVEAGDVLLFDGQPAILLPGGAGWSARMTDDDPAQWELEQPFDERRFEMTDDVQTDGGTTPLDPITVRVDAIAGEADLTLAELRALAPGSILALNRSATDPVRLLVNGRNAGEGELIQVEGELAVRVTRWSGR